MNKLDMAHDYMVAWMQSGNSEIIDANELAGFFFSVADAMQAEADKREPKGFPEAILTKKPNGECAHFHTTLNRTECFDCGEVLKQDDMAQPEVDWSVAPSWASKFTFMNDRADWVSSDNSVWIEAPSFGFTGSHIVERPHEA